MRRKLHLNEEVQSLCLHLRGPDTGMSSRVHFENWLYEMVTPLSEIKNTQGREGSELRAAG